MYQYDQDQMGPAARAVQSKQPSAPQKTKFTVDDLKEIMGVLGGAAVTLPLGGSIPQFRPSDIPVAVQRFSEALPSGIMGTPLSQVVIPPGNFNETVGYGEPPMAMNLRRIPIPEQPRVRVIPGQPSVVPPGYYE